MSKDLSGLKPGDKIWVLYDSIFTIVRVWVGGKNDRHLEYALMDKDNDVRELRYKTIEDLVKDFVSIRRVV